VRVETVLAVEVETHRLMLLSPAPLDRRFDSMEVVARLTRADLRSIERRSGVEILPGHQKLLFITARELRRERKVS